MQDDRLIVRHARIVLPEIGVVRGDLLVEAGRVSGIAQEGTGEGPTTSATKIVEADGRYLLPGFIDPHVHSGLLPPLRERLEAESAFAASGGITTIIRYFRRPESYLSTLPNQIALGSEVHYQDFAHHLALFTDEQVSEMGACVQRLGVTSFKLYMNQRGEHGKRMLMDLTPEAPDEMDTWDVDIDEGFIFRAFERASRVSAGLRINVHAELPDVVSVEMRRIRDLGLEGLPAWHAARPDISEALAIGMIGRLSQHFGIPIYIPHVGSRQAVDALRVLKANGVDFGAETCPQYISLSIESEAGPLAKVMPPVRTPEDTDSVWAAIAEGLLTSLGSDHIAYTLEEKQPGSIWTTRPAFGGTGLILPVFFSEGVQRGRIPIRRLVELGSSKTAQLFGLYPIKGTLLPGSDADFVLLNEENWTVRANGLLSASDFSVYEGLELGGRVGLTAVRGRIVYQDGEIDRSAAGHGVYYRRHPHIEASS
jgi:dihydropyrimidinase